MNRTIELIVGKLVVLVIGLLSVGASAGEVSVTCKVSGYTAICTPNSDKSFSSFAANMQELIGGGIAPNAIIYFDSPVTNYIGALCRVKVQTVAHNITGDINCNGNHARLYNIVIPNTGEAGSKGGTGIFMGPH